MITKPVLIEEQEGADDTVSFGTIATNQSATTVGNLKTLQCTQHL